MPHPRGSAADEPYAPVDAPLRLPIDLPDQFDADETDGDGVIGIIALCLMMVFAIAAILVLWVAP